LGLFCFLISFGHLDFSKMTRFFLQLSAILTITSFTACGPAAEDRERMHVRAKVFQDSIANFIHAAMNEAELPQGAVMMPPPGTATPQNTAAPQASPAPQATNANMGVNHTH
jgi:hypothetical protein